MQSNLYSQNKTEIFENLKSHQINFEEIEPGILKLRYPNGNVVYKDISNSTLTEDSIPTTLIDLRFIDTSLYSGMYEHWMDVVVANESQAAIGVYDINNNKLPELYGYKKEFLTSWDDLPFVVYEFNGDSFLIEHIYPADIRKYAGVYDINNDEGEQLYLLSYGNVSGNSFIKINDDSLPTAFDFSYYTGGQMDNNTFANLDNNNLTDLIYNTQSSRSVFVAEYDPTVNNLNIVYSFAYNEVYAGGYAVGDFDYNGKTDFAMGTIQGKVHVIEADSIRSYNKVWSGAVETKNSYRAFTTNDIDKNGKIEFWIYGDSYYNGIPITRMTCFEAEGEHIYKPVHRIDLVGVIGFSGFNGFAIDLLKTGTEEIFLCLSQTVLILQFEGEPNSHNYNLYYLKRNELADSNSIYYGATVFDINNNNNYEILITQDLVNQSNQRKDFTRIYRVKKPNAIEENRVSKKENNFSVFPNPFNSQAILRFNMDIENATVKVYNFLGETVEVIAKNKKIKKEEDIQWSPKNLSSGIYLISLTNNQFTYNKKILYLK